jgi:soluble lytic murein transglycosylase-like protein
MTTTAAWLALVALSNPAPQPVYHSGAIYQAETVAYYCDRFKIPRHLGMALIREESSFRIRLETAVWVGKGKRRHRVILSHGMTQTNPRYEKEFAAAVGLRVFDWRNPVESARVGLGRLAFLLRYFHGDQALAVSAYNAGIARIESRLPIPDETIVFLGRIFRDSNNGGSK